MVSETGIWKGKEFTSYLIKTRTYKNFSPIKQVAAICFNDEGKILLIKDPKRGYWSIPGGTPKKGEAAEETLIREVQEEASCDVEPLLLLGVIKVFFPENDNKEEGEVFYQLRYMAKVKKINEQTADPAKGRKLERIFIDPEDFLNYVPWTKDIGKVLLEIAKTFLTKNER